MLHYIIRQDLSLSLRVHTLYYINLLYYTIKGKRLRNVQNNMEEYKSIEQIKVSYVASYLAVFKVFNSSWKLRA